VDKLKRAAMAIWRRGNRKNAEENNNIQIRNKHRALVKDEINS
jgi:hypothetical protein